MLILGSNGFSVPSHFQKIAELIDDRSGNMLIIPLASENSVSVGEAVKKRVVSVGFSEEKIFVFDESKPSALLDMKFDCIAVTEGNTFKLLHEVRKYHLDELIKQRVADGAVYLGFSAGACLACPSIEHIKCFEDNNHITNGDFTALGLIDKYVLCHYDNRGIPGIMACREVLGYGAELITVCENELIVLEQCGFAV